MKSSGVRRPLWVKLVLALMIVACIGFAVSGIAQVYMMENYIRDQKTEMVLGSIERISHELEMYVVSVLRPTVDIQHEIRLQILKASVQRETEYLVEANIWIIDKEGYIRMEYPEIDWRIKSEYKVSPAGAMQIPAEAMHIMNVDEEVLYDVPGDFFGVLSKIQPEQEPWDIVSYKMKVDTETFLIVISMPHNNWSIHDLPIGRMFARSFLWTTLFCLMLALAISLPLSKRISSLRKAAQKIAIGDFDVELPEESSDEVGQLVSSFNQMTESLSELENMRSQFISNVSHELRTPMTSILGFIEGIQDGTIPPEQREYYLGIVRDEVKRLHKLTNDLLELTRIESGRAGIKIVNTNLSEVLRRSLISLAPLFDEKSLEVFVDLGDEDVYVPCDGDMIQRVVVNILHNAIKFTSAQGVISLSLKENKNYASVTISDSGPGLSQEDQHRIWERFYKGDKSRGQNANGIGLGMSIAWNIIKEHGGTINAANAQNGGAEFVFTLPKENS